MNTRFDLPGSNWADLRDPQTVSERHRRTINRLRQTLSHVSPEFIDAIVKADGDKDKLDVTAMITKLSPEGFDASEQMNDAVIIALVDSWSFFDVPITIDGVQDLPGPAYQMLLKECAERGKSMYLSTEPDPDPEAPTEP